MSFSVEQALVGRDEKRAPLKTPAWEASCYQDCSVIQVSSDSGTLADLQKQHLDWLA